MLSPAVPLGRRLLAEGLGTGLLVTVVVGSGIAAQRLSPGDPGLQLLENSLVTALGLGVLPWSPLGRGVLTGKYRSGMPADSRAASPHGASNRQMR